jgi:hypothetical protein
MAQETSRRVKPEPMAPDLTPNKRLNLMAPPVMAVQAHDTFLFPVYLIRLHIKSYQKNLYLLKKFTFIRTRCRQNQHLWRQNGVIMSPGNQGVF